MRAPPPPADPVLIAAQYEAAPGTARLRELKDSFAAASPETVEAILDEAVKLARLALVAATAQVLHNGLAVLGVSAPRKM